MRRRSAIAFASSPLTQIRTRNRLPMMLRRRRWRRRKRRRNRQSGRRRSNREPCALWNDYLRSRDSFTKRVQQSGEDAAMTPTPGKRLVKKTREKIGSDGFSCMRCGGSEGQISRITTRRRTFRRRKWLSQWPNQSLQSVPRLLQRRRARRSRAPS